MIRLSAAWILAACTCLLLPLAGCDSKTAPSPTSSSDGHDHDEHGHDHDHHGHSHDQLGPHGGHLLELGDEQYHAEWTHNAEAKSVTVYFLDAEAKKEVEIEPGTARIVVDIQGKSPTSYPLAASTDETDGAGYTNTDSALLTGLNMVGQGVQAKLYVTIAGEEFEAEFTPHDHDHHGHAH